MFKLLILGAIICFGCKLALGKWPWDYLRGPTARQQALVRARKLLAVDAKASHEEIMAAHKKLIAMVHPDKGGSNEQVHEANAARDLLLDELPNSSQSEK